MPETPETKPEAKPEYLGPELRAIFDRWEHNLPDRFAKLTMTQIRVLAQLLHLYNMGFGATHVVVSDVLAAFNVIDNPEE